MPQGASTSCSNVSSDYSEGSESSISDTHLQHIGFIEEAKSKAKVSRKNENGRVKRIISENRTMEGGRSFFYLPCEKDQVRCFRCVLGTILTRRYQSITAYCFCCRCVVENVVKSSSPILDDLVCVI